MAKATVTVETINDSYPRVKAVLYIDKRAYFVLEGTNYEHVTKAVMLEAFSLMKMIDKANDDAKQIRIDTNA